MNQSTILNIGQALVSYNPGFCRGVFITKNLIATAAHCLRDRPPNNVEVHIRNGDVLSGSIVHCDFKKDIGLIHVPQNHNQEPLNLYNNHLIPGCKIARAGLINERSDNGLAFDLEYGTYQRTIPMQRDWSIWGTEMLCLRLDSPKGYSGSPIIYNGMICGILVSGNDVGQIFAVPSKFIYELL